MPIPQASGEKSYMVERWSLNGFQLATLAATPMYALHALRKGQFSIRQLVRYNWVVPILGAGAGGGGAFAMTSQESAAKTASRTMEMRMSKSTVRRDDMQLIGSVVGALLVPAIFLRSAGLFNGLLGGAGLGSAAGILTDYFKNGGSVEDLKQKGRNVLSEGKELGAEASKAGKDLGSEVRQKGEQLANKAN
ncbi:hypothetical protein CBS101457_001772 [Exobasidium rhododendri]|nr:hypothetical protein CBS101457_001772 [Exobasidium rhododendri]